MAPRELIHRARQQSTLRSWLDHFNEDQIANVPALAVASAASRLAAGDGDQARHWASAASRALARHPSTSPCALDGAAQLMRAVVAEAGLAQMGRDAARACAVSPEDGDTRSFAHLLAGVGHHLTGDRPRARAALEEGASLERRDGSTRPGALPCAARPA